MLISSCDESIVAFQEFKCKAKCKPIKATIEFIYSSFENNSIVCDVIFATDEPKLYIIFGSDILEGKYYSDYDANFQKMTICKDTLTINCKNKVGTELQIKITPD